MGKANIAELITDIPDYPKKGVLFKDITTILLDPDGLAAVIDAITRRFSDAGITKVVGSEARGFILASPVAYCLHAGFVPARKPGKLPRETISRRYALEYGSDMLEIHRADICPDDKILIVDDLIATGGTAIAQAKMVKELGAELCGFAFLVELSAFQPEKLLSEFGAEYYSLLKVV